MSTPACTGVQIMTFEPFVHGNVTPLRSQSSQPALHIPDRFYKAVFGHCRNIGQMTVMPEDIHPLLMFIAGDKGMGKTFMLEQSLKQMGLRPRIVSASSIAGQYEGDSVAVLRSLILEECHGQRRANSGIPAVIFDDFDKSIAGGDHQTSKTGNSDIANGYLMNLADQRFSFDHPTRDQRNGELNGVSKMAINPPAIFFTVNDMKRIYPPLSRDIRASKFTWKPTKDELIEMMESILPSLSRAERTRLQQAYPLENVAFFAEVARRAADIAVDKALEKSGLLNNSNVLFDDNGLMRCAEISRAATQNLKHKDVLACAEAAFAANERVNHLKSPKSKGRSR